MKTKLLLGILVLLMVTFVVAQPPLPFPISGQISVDGIPQGQLTVTVTNKDTGGSMEITTDDNGKYTFLMDQLPGGYEVHSRRYAGDTIEIKACDGDPKCVQSFVLLDTRPKNDVNFNFIKTDVSPETRFTVNGKSIAIGAIGIVALATLAELVAGYFWGKGFLAMYRKKRKETQEKAAKTIAERKKKGKYG